MGTRFNSSTPAIQLPIGISDAEHDALSEYQTALDAAVIGQVATALGPGSIGFAYPAASGLSQYPNTWVVSATNGDFANLQAIQQSGMVLDGDNIIVIGPVATGGLAVLAKSLNFILYPNATLTLPASVTAANTYISGTMSALHTGAFTAPALGIVTGTVSGNLYLSGIRVMRAAPTTQTLTVTGSVFSANSITWVVANLAHSSGTTLITNSAFLSGVATLSSSVLYVINSYMLSLTRSGGTSIFVSNSWLGTLNISAASHTVTMMNSDVSTTLTLPATVVAASRLRHVSAGTITAPGAVTINSGMGVYDAKNANVTFTAPSVNSVGGVL